MEEIKVVEAVDRKWGDEAVALNQSGTKPEFFQESQAFEKNKSKVALLNELTKQVFERSPSLGQFAPDGIGARLVVGARVTIPASALPDLGYPWPEFGISGIILDSGKIKLDAPIREILPGGAFNYIDILDLQEIGLIKEETQPARYRSRYSAADPAAEPEPPPASPHDAMLNPKRKLRIGQ